MSSEEEARNLIKVIQWPKYGLKKTGRQKIEIEWSELSFDENKSLVEVIEQNYKEINERIDNLFNGKKVEILKVNKINKKK